MTTQYINARDAVITDQMRRVAERENRSPETIRDEIAAGRLVIPANRVHLNPAGPGATPLDPCGIGSAVTTKINANIGSSPDR